MMEMPKVVSCTVADCAYNSSQICRAMAITVGDIGKQPKCDTFLQAAVHGGVQDVTAGVGACKIERCSYNKDLECSAQDIKIGTQNGNAECLTFKKK